VQGQAPGHEDQEDQEVSQQGGESQVGACQAPPSPAIDLVKVLNNQNLLLEALTNVITNPRPREQSTNDKLIPFLRTKPPTFAGSNNPLDADDWLRVIKRKLDHLSMETVTRSVWMLTSSLKLLWLGGRTTVQLLRMPPLSLGRNLWMSSIAITSQQPPCSARQMSFVSCDKATSPLRSTHISS
jgi:hypothetical protein